MEEVLYIICEEKAPDEYWYNLIYKPTHFCLACGHDLDKILGTISNYVKTYRTKEKFSRAISNLDRGGLVSPATYEVREQYYKDFGDDYSEIISEVVLVANKERREEERLNSPLVKAKSLLKKAGVVKKETPTKKVLTSKAKPPVASCPPRTIKSPLAKRPVLVGNKKRH